MNLECYFSRPIHQFTTQCSHTHILSPSHIMADHTHIHGRLLSPSHLVADHIPNHGWHLSPSHLMVDHTHNCGRFLNPSHLVVLKILPPALCPTLNLTELKY